MEILSIDDQGLNKIRKIRYIYIKNGDIKRRVFDRCEKIEVKSDLDGRKKNITFVRPFVWSLILTVPTNSRNIF